METIQKTDIEREIRAFLVKKFLWGREDGLTDNSALLGGIIDSTGVLELVMFLQDRFGITVADEDVGVPENFDSLKNVVGLVEKKLLAKG
jgi:acyl carrier protein